jgi:hypothetical protein
MQKEFQPVAHSLLKISHLSCEACVFDDAEPDIFNYHVDLNNPVVKLFTRYESNREMQNNIQSR